MSFVCLIGSISGFPQNQCMSKLFFDLPEWCNTHDAMVFHSNENAIYLSVLNFYNTNYPGIIIKIDMDGNCDTFSPAYVHPETVRGELMGLEFGSDENLYYTDYQHFYNAKYKPRVIRQIIENEKPIHCETVSENKIITANLDKPYPELTNTKFDARNNLRIIKLDNGLEIKDLKSASGKLYGLNTLIKGEYQYMDRSYQFNYIPKELEGVVHIKTCGDDKLISENDTCVSFNINCDADIFILYADKFPIIPNWLNEFERVRLNVTRQDSRISDLKGYFSLFRKTFRNGTVTLYGCSSCEMLKKDWFVQSSGGGYCMYSIAVKRKE